MAAEARGLHEARTRVTFFLPVGNNNEEKAIRSVIDYLERQRKRSIPVTGFTRSQFPDAVFAGYWWSDTRSKWDEERVISFVIDYGFPLDDRQLGRTLGRLKQIIEDRYAHYESVQEEIWIIAQRVLRYT
jgi:hypothetical protein